MMKRSALVGCLAATVVAVSACGAGGDSLTAEEGLTKLTIGETSGIPAGFLEYGVSSGLFEEHGLEVEVSTSAGGAAAIPALLSGELDVAGSNAVSTMLASHKGMPITMIAPGTFATDDPTSDFSAVLVPEGSEIADAEGLAGKTVAVNTLENIGDTTISAVLEGKGVDANSVSFVELSFPDMLAALDNGNVDAAWVIEPFMTIGMAQGNVAIMRPYAEAKPGLQVGSFVTTKQFVEGNPEAVTRFREAVGQIAESVANDDASFRASIQETQGLEREVAEELVLPIWGASIDRDSMDFLADQMLTQGLVDNAIDVDAVIAD